MEETKSTLDKIKGVIESRIRPTTSLDIVVGVLRQFHGKMCNKKLVDAILVALRAEWPNANCWIEKSGVLPFGSLKLWWWGEKYDNRQDLKIADHHDQSRARVDMVWIEQQNTYLFGGIQESNRKYSTLLADRDGLDELADAVDEYHKFVAFMGLLFNRVGANDVKTSIGKACGIEL